MKKHELLEKAMRDYPKGTIAIHEGSTAKHYSTGLFKIKNDDYNGVCVLSDTGTECFYSENTNGEYGPTWAVPVPESILSGKCAIQVTNEREFKLLMEHYESKGWESLCGGLKDDEYNRHGVISVSYHDKFHYHSKYTFKGNELHNVGYELIQFQDFAKEVEIEHPVLFMRSHDNIDLYIGDYCYIARLLSEEWSLDCHHGEVKDRFKVTDNGYFVNNEKKKVFHSKESAEKWILEANKPKEIICAKDSTYPVSVTKSIIRILCGDTQSHEYNITISPQELEQIYTAYKSLQ